MTSKKMKARCSPIWWSGLWVLIISSFVSLICLAKKLYPYNQITYIKTLLLLMRILGSQENIGDALIFDFRGLSLYWRAVAQTEIPLRSLKCFLPRKLGEVEDKRCQLFEP
jgi:hypothetical protein